MVFNRDFDRRYQVTRMNGGASDRRYTRDKNGRVTGITNVRTPSLAGLNAALGYAGKSNRLEKISGAGAGKYAYDANGNTLSDGRHAFTYDALNRLVSVSVQNTVKARYTYDAWNRRTSKTAGGRTIHYHYDQDSRLIGESLANGTVLREYVYLRGEPVALLEYETQPGWYFYVTDHLGTPQQMVDAQGTVVWQAACLPYGEAKVLKATVQNNLRFPGQYFDAETGLHYNWNRYYNPKTGRYITVDPIGLAGGMNLYAYVGGNPVNAVDLEGLYSWIEFLDDAANFSAGFGDTISFGGTKLIREQWDEHIWMDNQSSINECSSSYNAGEFSGYVWEIAISLSSGGNLLGWSINFNIYKHGGFGINFLKNNSRKFAIDWHRFKHNGEMVNKPHYHRGSTKSQMKKHRPWQGK